jgi:hypothetical protein
MRERLPVRQMSGRVLLVVGTALIILAPFSPWFRLYTTFGDTTVGEHSYGPWTLLSAGGGGDAIVAVGLLICFPVVALAASVAPLVVRGRRPQTFLTAPALVLAICGLMVTLLVMAGLPTGLALTWPYFTLRAVEYGAYAALAGCACITLGVIILPAGR